MITYMEMLKESQDLNPDFIKLAKMDLMYLEVNYETQRCAVRRKPTPPNLSQIQKMLLEEYFDNSGYKNRLDMLIRFALLREGPKVFRPSAIQCRLLEQMTLNISFEEYQQPYTTFVIEYPESFADTRILEANVEKPSTDMPSHLYMYRPDKANKPAMSILHMDRPNRIVIHAMICENMSMNISIYSASYETLEDWLEESRNHCSENEVAMRRIALAYSMILDEYGVKRIGPVDPEEHARLTAKAKRKSAVRFDAERLLAAQPQYFDINQTPILARIHRESTETGDPTGRKVRPHFRRGHYANVACGIGRTERRRVRRPPVFVNEHLFLGDMGNVMVTYTSEEVIL